MFSRHGRQYQKNYAILSPSAGIVGSLASVSGLNLSTNATDKTILVLVNGLKVSFFPKPISVVEQWIGTKFHIQSRIVECAICTFQNSILPAWRSCRHRYPETALQTKMWIKVQV